jgi:hypothetical protein
MVGIFPQDKSILIPLHGFVKYKIANQKGGLSKNMGEIIVKVQRPLGGNMDNLLIYNQDRLHEFRVPVDSVPGRELLKLMGTHPKMYCRFYTSKQTENYNQWRYKGRVRDQGW